MRRRINIWSSIDKTTILLFLLMIIMGWLNIYSAVYNEEANGILDLSQRYGKQFIWIITTLILAAFIIITDSRFYLFFSWIIYGIIVLLLLLVLLFGKEVNGARSWFEFGGLTIQPSEFAKPATALALASLLSSARQDLTRIKAVFYALVIIFLPVILIMLQPDMGSSVIFFALLIVLFREGFSPYLFVSGLLMLILFFLTLLVNNVYLIIALIIIAFIFGWLAVRKLSLLMSGLAIFIVSSGVVYLFNRFIIKTMGYEMMIVISIILTGIAYSYHIFLRKNIPVLVIYLFLVGSVLYVNFVDYGYNNLLKPHQKERVSIMIGLKSDPHGTGYNVNQSIISIGSGGLKGKGYLQGTQTKFKFVPAQSTDFIFCTVGEEWGFIGSFVVVGLYLTLFIRLIILAERQRSVFSRIYGYGVVSILFAHFFINIGMSIGMVPVIGIPLPFFSYGGSSLWGFTILLFIFLRLDASRTEYLV